MVRQATIYRIVINKTMPPELGIQDTSRYPMASSNMAGNHNELVIIFFFQKRHDDCGDFLMAWEISKCSIPSIPLSILYALIAYWMYLLVVKNANVMTCYVYMCVYTYIYTYGQYILDWHSQRQVYDPQEWDVNHLPSTASKISHDSDDFWIAHNL